MNQKSLEYFRKAKKTLSQLKEEWKGFSKQGYSTIPKMQFRTRSLVTFFALPGLYDAISF